MAVVTGATSGIGKAIAHHLLINLGYKLIMIARDRTRLLDVELEFKSILPTANIEIINVDVSDFIKVASYLTPVLNVDEKVDLLINSAGYVKSGTSDLDPHEFLKMVNTNLVGPFNLINLVAPYMKKNKTGRIINISSISGIEARAELGGYAASKFGLMGLNESLHKELASYGILVTAICPNLVRTEMTKDVSTLNPDELVDVEEIVKAVDFILLSSKNIMLKEIVLRNRCNFLQARNLGPT